MMHIAPMNSSHWPAVEQIYLSGIATGMATFETQSPGWERWDENHMDTNRWVALVEDQVAGWIALSPTSDRCVYGGVAEVSVYVNPDFKRRGVGKALLKKVIESSETEGIWTLHAAMFPQNEGSIGLHQAMGFRKIGIREKIAKLNGEWHDNLLMERRSPNIW
ncbi:MAG: N-acetyltransferase family protein [Bacteroidota bacterium]